VPQLEQTQITDDKKRLDTWIKGNVEKYRLAATGQIEQESKEEFRCGSIILCVKKSATEAEKTRSVLLYRLLSEIGCPVVTVVTHSDKDDDNDTIATLKAAEMRKLFLVNLSAAASLTGSVVDNADAALRCVTIVAASVGVEFETFPGLLA